MHNNRLIVNTSWPLRSKWKSFHFTKNNNFVFRMSHVTHHRMLKFHLQSDFLFQFSSLWKEEKNALKLLHGFTDRVIQERKQSIVTEPNCNKDDFDGSVGEKRKMNFLDILLQSNINGEPLSDLDIREEVDTFMFEVSYFTQSLVIFVLFKSTFHRVTTRHHQEYYFACIILLNIPTYNANATRKSEKS